MRCLLLSATLAGALAWTAQAPARPVCSASVRTSGGVTYRTFCGPAKATLNFGGKTYLFSGGSCDSTSSAFTINIGTITLQRVPPKYRYFGITVFTRHDGAFANQAVAWQLPNGTRGSLFHARIVLKGHRTQGTFAGTTLVGGVKGSGTFRCS